MIDYRDEFDAARGMAERYLESRFTGSPLHGTLYEAMRYSLLAGGKRIRPVLALKWCEAVGGDMEKALPVACAVEMVHTYSLIHDDLPCMDNDVLRRGKPTNHVVYGECMAMLAGDALQAAAFSTVLSAELPAERLARAALYLSRAAGEDGMCAGQVLDMEGETRKLSLDEVRNVHDRKTAAMIIGACRMGVAAGGGSEEDMRRADAYAEAVGLTFQIRDDILDVTSTTEEMGKTVGKDARDGKSTFVSLLGIEKCEELIAAQTQKAKDAVKGMKNEAFFCWLAEMLAGRKN